MAPTFATTRVLRSPTPVDLQVPPDGQGCPEKRSPVLGLQGAPWSVSGSAPLVPVVLAHRPASFTELAITSGTTAILPVPDSITNSEPAFVPAGSCAPQL